MPKLRGTHGCYWIGKRLRNVQGFSHLFIHRYCYLSYAKHPHYVLGIESKQNNPDARFPNNCWLLGKTEARQVMTALAYRVYVQVLWFKHKGLRYWFSEDRGWSKAFVPNSRAVSSNMVVRSPLKLLRRNEAKMQLLSCTSNIYFLKLFFQIIFLFFEISMY